MERKGRNPSQQTLTDLISARCDGETICSWGCRSHPAIACSSASEQERGEAMLICERMARHDMARHKKDQTHARQTQRVVGKTDLPGTGGTVPVTTEGTQSVRKGLACWAPARAVPPGQRALPRSTARVGAPAKPSSSSGPRPLRTLASLLRLWGGVQWLCFVGIRFSFVASVFLCR